MLLAIEPVAAAQVGRAGRDAARACAAAPTVARWSKPALAWVAIGGVATALWFGPTELSVSGRLTLIAFAAATIAWALLRLPETTVALAAALGLVATGAVQPADLYAGMGNDLIWLLVGAFVLAAVLRQSGLAQRLALRALAGTGSVRALFYRITALICATAFVIPSTSGRAALLLPLFLALAAGLRDAALVRALALLFPSVILLSACASLLGAGAHLVAVDFIARLGLPAIGFFEWALLGLPFAIASSLLACALILRLFVGGDASRLPVALPPPASDPATREQRHVLLIVLATVAFWASAGLHQVDAAIVALAGALVATSRRITGISLKEALKSVEWNLILFLALTLVLGHALIDSGAAHWVARNTVATLPPWVLSNPPLVVVFAAVAAMLSHLIITSRSARAAVLIPTLALPLAAVGIEAAALIFLTVVASGFCQTLNVSAKPVALYAKLEVPTYAPADLMRLSLWLMPFFAALLIVFSLWVWPLLGLPLFRPV